jgi:hypothetical protein
MCFDCSEVIFANLSSSVSVADLVFMSEVAMRLPFLSRRLFTIVYPTP